MREHLRTPAGFSFRRTLLSHGWCTLPPFEVGPGASWVAATIAVPHKRAARIRLTPAEGHVVLESPGQPSQAVRRHLAAAGRRVLNLDIDLAPFYAAVRRTPELRWIERTDSGRLLRSPSVFEDLAKLVLTTNCSWALTKRMVGAVIDTWGEASPGGERSFPGPEALAAAGEIALREKARVGYRAPLLAALAEKVATGEVDPEAWEHDPRDPSELRREMMSLPGVGPYVAENLLKFLGRPEGLALDSWMRSKYARMFHEGRRVTDRTILRRYRNLGSWAGLAIWCDLTRDWFLGDEPSAAWDKLT